MKKLIHNFDGTEDLLCTDRIEVLCHLEKADWVACKIIKDLGYTRIDPYKPNPEMSYYVTNDMYDFIDNLIQSADSKNGVQIYQDTDTEEYYIQITGSVFYDKIGKPVTENTVKVYLKEFVW